MTQHVYRRYQREFLPAMLAYAAVMLVLWPLTRRIEDTGLKALLALLPMLPLGLAIRAMVRLVMRTDELDQRIHLTALGVSSAVVGMACMSAGFLAAARVVAVPGTALLWVFPLQCLSYGLARWWAGRRYGMAAMEEDCGVLTPPRVLLAAVVCAALSLALHRVLSDWQTGFLIGMAAAFLAWAAVMLVRRRWRHRRGGDA
ncbi:hypothetical protein [Frateuria defendens]|uniref:hypothetical protein n=1 Tax=Frateuria defendens TaxID=2219559 RepID=UPI00066FB89B|nr:hypothetical protein [Frateuria defendens]